MKESRISADVVFSSFSAVYGYFFMWFQSSNKNFVDDGMHIVMDLNKRFQARLFTHLIDTHDDEWDGRVLSSLVVQSPWISQIFTSKRREKMNYFDSMISLLFA